MSKPPGLTWDFRVTRSSPTQDAIYDAVERAVDDGWTVERFRREARECWQIATRKRQQADERAWERD